MWDPTSMETEILQYGLHLPINFKPLGYTPDDVLSDPKHVVWIR